jgi:hypothetical protein
MQANDQSKKIRIRKERDFKPHHILIYAANAELSVAEKITKEEKGISEWTPHELAAIIFSAFALEAICNSFGKKFIPKWDEEFERSKGPITKLKIICSKLGIEHDLEKEKPFEPWQSAKWLVEFRNDIAHAKPNFIKTDDVVSASEYTFWHLHSDPPSEIEKQITLENAGRAVKAIHEILDLFYLKIKSEERGSLFFDGSAAMASHVETN